MKKLLLTLLLAAGITQAQVKIGTNPTTLGASSLLELENTNKALLITRVANTGVIASPVNGMIIYDLSVNCFKGYQNGSWTDCGLLFVSPTTNGSAIVSAYSCSTSTAGTLTTGVPATAFGVTQTITATVTTPGTYNIITPTVNGVYFSATGTFTGTGAQNIVLTATGTPTAAGTNSFTLNTTPSCSFNRTTVNPAVAPTNAIGTGSFSGKTCFDVAISNDNANGCGALSNRTALKSDFTSAATNTQIYTFTPSGTVSNVRFVYVNTNGYAITSLTGGNAGNNISTPVTATVTYANALNSLATGLTSSNPITSNIYVVYNNSANNTGSDVQLKLTANIKDCACCGAFVAANQFKEFMCHNLGANYSADPFTPSAAIHGAKYAWGAQTGEAGKYISQADDQSNSGTIPGFDWLNTGWATSTTLWRDDIKTAKDPCPAGYRVPTRANIDSMIVNNVIDKVGLFIESPTNYYTGVKVGSLLFLPAAGSREQVDGTLARRGELLQYQTSTGPSTTGQYSYSYGYTYLNVPSGTDFNKTQLRNSNTPFSVRCIKE
jgi:hypothetical protein